MLGLAIVCDFEVSSDLSRSFLFGRVRTLSTSWAARIHVAAQGERGGKELLRHKTPVGWSGS